MKIGILGYGKEGQSADRYFREHGHETTIFDNFTSDTLKGTNLATFDLILRSPSARPQPGWSSMTQYFFDHCPCQIIGVTGTKGKGTTSSIITAILKALGKQVYLVGNIGTPAIEILDQLTPTDVVVYEMSSFQLWDLQKSPQIAVVLGIEPDHLNVHKDFAEYVEAKANIAKHQTTADTCIYYAPNPNSTNIAMQSSGQKIPYPITPRDPNLNAILTTLAIPGQHNRDNAEAALLATAAYYQLPLIDFIAKFSNQIVVALQNFQGLPHRLQFVRTFNQVDYYDDNFSTTPTSLQVALDAFSGQPIVLILGGRDKTSNQDLPEIVSLINNHPNIAQIVLLGESGRELHKTFTDAILAVSLQAAVAAARQAAEQLDRPAVVLMSPAAASFDMFQNVYDRGAQFQKLVQELQ